MPYTKAGKSITIAMVAGIIILQCLNLFYWQNQRGNFYIDELYSLGTAHSYTTDSNPYITDRPEWKYGEWLNADEIQDMLRVDRNESISSLPAGKQLRLFATKRPFMGLLNYIMFAVGVHASFFQYANAVVILNAIFLIISELLLAYCVLSITGSRALAVMSLVMFGFSSIIVGMCEYLRFYMLTIMLLLITVICHRKMMGEKDSRRFFAWETGAFISAYFAFLHSELMLITCGALFGFFILYLLISKRFRHAVIYSLPLVLGVYGFVYRKTNLIDVLLHPANYAQPDSHGVAGITNNLMTFTPERGLVCTKNIMMVIGEKWFGNIWIMYLCLTLMIVGAVVSAYRKRKGGRKENGGDDNSAFVVIMLLIAATSLFFNILTNLPTDRHNSFAIVLLMIVFWYCAGRLQHIIDWKKYLAIAAALTIVCAVTNQQVTRYPFIFTEDLPTRDIAEEYDRVDCILFISGDNKGYNPHWEQHAAYDAVIHAGKQSRMYVFDPDKEPSLKKVKDKPDRFLAFCIRVGASDRMSRALEGTKYESELIGTTHLNEIYLCTKK